MARERDTVRHSMLHSKALLPVLSEQLTGKISASTT